MCASILFFFFSFLDAEADDDVEGESAVISNRQGREGHLSYLDVEMILLSGHDARIPKQKMQAECCRVKAIRWSSFYVGY